MTKTNHIEMIRVLINKIYNTPNLTDDLLVEIKKDIKQISKLVDENKAYRELLVLIDAAKVQKLITARNNFKFAILSGLEKEYKKLNIQKID